MKQEKGNCGSWQRGLDPTICVDWPPPYVPCLPKITPQPIYVSFDPRNGVTDLNENLMPIKQEAELPCLLGFHQISRLSLPDAVQPFW